jgi:methylated-DNA-[protein]-cysteine S-methyltransferase
MLEMFTISSPIGPLRISITGIGLKSIELLEDDGTPIEDVLSERAIVFKDQIDEYFDGVRQSFSLPLDLTDLPPFHREVLKMVYIIPYGKTRSYKQIATILENPKAVRAVGQANNKNPIPIVIPCHRVIGNNGELHGYAYGVDVKMKLLEHENPHKYVPQIDMFATLV